MCPGSAAAMLRTFALKGSYSAEYTPRYFHWPTDRHFGVIDMLPIETRRAAGSDPNSGAKP